MPSDLNRTRPYGGLVAEYAAQRALRTVRWQSADQLTLCERSTMELRGHGLAVARTGRFGRHAAGSCLPKLRHRTVQSTD
ncbi:hypothetical protein ADL00_43210 [Streptomyces sp. AS58]|nr:hypothetical protein ADL00_43210 [Streptomyces sp. AS58]